MPNAFIRVATACTFGVALMMSSASVIALEKTATKEVDQVSTDLNTEMKVTAFTASLKAAIQALIDRVNLFDGRIDALEAWRTGIDASIADILARLAALENGLSYLLNTWKPWVEGQLGNLNVRVTNIENRPAAGTISNSGECTAIPFTAQQNKTWRMCPADYFVSGIMSQGLQVDAKKWYGQIYCCKLRMQ